MSECSLGTNSQPPLLSSSQPPPLTVLSISDEYASRLPHHVDAAYRSAQGDSWRERAWSELVADRDALRLWRQTCNGKLQLFAHFSERGSVLFKEQVRKARAEAEAEAETGSAQWTTDELFDAGDRAILSLERLVDPDRVSFDDVRACVGATKEVSVERELQAIVDWPPLAHLADNIDACIQNVSTQVALLRLAVPLDAFTNCLEQYRFACATSATPLSAPRTGPVAKGKAEENMLTAAKLGDHAALLKALEAGADVRATDYIGYTALHWAAEGGRLGDIHLLLSAASPLDKQSTFNDTLNLFVELALFGSTPLILASSMGRDDCVSALLAAGASAAVATSQGKTALQVATEKRDKADDKEEVARLDECIALLSAPASATVGGDPDFHFLRALAVRLLDESAMSSRTMAECRDDLCRAARLLGDSSFGGSSSAGLDALTMHHLALFAKLSSATHVVELVGGQGWNDAAGLLRFHQDYGNVTNLLQGEDYQTDVLNQLDAAVHYVAAAMQARALPLAEVLPSVLSGLATVVRDGALGGFSELGVVQANVLRIRAWFTRSLGDLEGTFEEVRITVGLGVYEFSRDRHAHGAPYMSLVREGADTLSGSALDDFARRLGFVQRDEKGAGLRIREVLAEFLEYQKALEAMRELAALGHPLLDAGPIWRGVLAEPSDEVSRWASELKGEAVAWRKQLAVARASHPYLLLLSTAEARALYAALGDVSSSISLRDLAVAYFPRFFLAALLPARSRHPTRQLRTKIRDFVRAFHAGASAVPTVLASWPEAVGNFASRLRAALDSPLPVRPAVAAEGSGESSGVHVHNCDGAELELFSRLLLRLWRSHAGGFRGPVLREIDARERDRALPPARVRTRAAHIRTRARRPAVERWPGCPHLLPARPAARERARAAPLHRRRPVAHPARPVDSHAPVGAKQCGRLDAAVARGC
ncbi:hypothetical protein T492DRAFT_444041 [Pavlovales sp. CCMP2436]|nr:hypothetical protein T492DRAFT_444041 [Pavlovales sp. CCMP2436]